MPKQWAVWEGMRLKARLGQTQERTLDAVLWNGPVPTFLLNEDEHGDSPLVRLEHLLAERVPVDKAVPEGVTLAVDIAKGQRWERDGVEYVIQRLAYENNRVPVVLMSRPDAPLHESERFAPTELIVTFKKVTCEKTACAPA